MSVSGKELIAFASSLKSSDNETQRRAAVSRGYYACYHEVKAKLNNFDGIVGRSSHEGLIEYLTSNSCHLEPFDNKAMLKLGYALRVMKGNRVKADYHIEFDLDSSESAASVSSMEHWRSFIARL